MVVESLFRHMNCVPIYDAASHIFRNKTELNEVYQRLKLGAYKHKLSIYVVRKKACDEVYKVAQAGPKGASRWIL
jgi:hypothetical protein